MIYVFKLLQSKTYKLKWSPYGINAKIIQNKL